MLLEDGHGWQTYKGKMKDENVVVVFSYPDPEDNETLATVGLSNPTKIPKIAY